MITEHDLQEAIAECQGERNPDSRTCIKLAAFYTIRDHLYPGPEAAPPEAPTYSYDPGPVENTITYQSDTDFSRMIHGRDPADVWPVMDELMETLRVIHKRLYNGVILELEE